MRHPVAGKDAAARFDIYRNNVICGLQQNLRDGFPLLVKLLGDAPFDALAAAYARAHLPATPLMYAYGAALPDFIDGFAPLAQLPYASDVARLELAMRASAHAVDHTPMATEAIQLAALAERSLILAPCLRLLASAWPLHELHAFLNEAADALENMMQPQNLMIYRTQNGGLALEPLSEPSFAFIQAVADGTALAAAAQNVTHDELAACLTRLLMAGLIIDINEGGS